MFGHRRMRALLPHDPLSPMTICLLKPISNAAILASGSLDDCFRVHRGKDAFFLLLTVNEKWIKRHLQAIFQVYKSQVLLRRGNNPPWASDLSC